MKAMILAAGRGERMRPLTDGTPKPLLKVAGKRLIEYHLENLVRAGVQEVIINHAWLGEQIPACLGNGQQYGLAIHYSDEGNNALETAGGIINALPLLGSEPFILINGDIWTDYEFSSLLAHPHTNSLMHLVLVANPAHNPKGDFDIDEKGRLIDHAAHTYSGIGLYSAKIFTKLKAGAPVLPLAPVIRTTIGEQNATGEVYRGTWTDVGTPERLTSLESFLSAKALDIR